MGYHLLASDIILKQMELFTTFICNIPEEDGHLPAPSANKEQLLKAIGQLASVIGCSVVSLSVHKDAFNIHFKPLILFVIR